MTGTLTHGKPELTRIVSSESFDENEFLRIAAALETGSEHSLAAAIPSGTHTSTKRSFS